jgi:endonuclease III
MQTKAARIQAILDDLFPVTPIPLDHVDPFSLLVAVVLSAQTTDARVNMVTPRLFALASTPAKMASLDEATILDAIRTCGLAPAKAKNIRRLSQILVETHGGEVPRTFEELEALPGVGHKTASVVMAQAFGVPAITLNWSSPRQVTQGDMTFRKAKPLWLMPPVIIMLDEALHVAREAAADPRRAEVEIASSQGSTAGSGLPQ